MSRACSVSKPEDNERNLLEAVDPLEPTKDGLRAIAADVAAGRRSYEQAQPDVAELCMRHGPALVRPLDAYFEAEIARIKNQA